MQKLSPIRIALLTGIGLLLVAIPVLAYIDPSFGNAPSALKSFVSVGVILAMGFALFKYRRTVLNVMEKCALLPPKSDPKTDSGSPSSSQALALLLAVPIPFGGIAALLSALILDIGKVVPAVTCILFGLCCGFAAALAMAANCYRTGWRWIPCLLTWCWAVVGLYSALITVAFSAEGLNRSFFRAVWDINQW
jgi:hypothetical protein